ncbi:MAG: hypothetical protein LBM96_06025 [Methanobrevibacter sp.]|jgi:hypothetical protein|nr:hypothetical protein [Candidatus Methanoflexus mossambicus]
MNTSYFTFGQDHVHKCGNATLDKDCIVKIEAEDPREEMFRLFGSKWAMQYDESQLEDIIKYYPRGVFDLKSSKFIK